MGDRFPELSESDLNMKQTWLSNDKTVITPGYRKTQCLVDQLYADNLLEQDAAPKVN